MEENIALLKQVFYSHKPAHFKLRFWKGEEWSPPGL